MLTIERMDFPTMLAYLKADPKRRAKRLHWEWANLAWQPAFGVYRGDTMNVRPGAILTALDWTADDWVACNERGRLEDGSYHGGHF